MKLRSKGIKNNHPYPTASEINEKAKLAYFTYATNSLKNGAYGNVMPVWDELFPNQKAAWRQVVLTFHKQSKNVPRGTFIKTNHKKS